ncbi:cell wall hydrolase [Alteriqipengyuania lutimaris]|uniref:Cell wall hydrolase n=1 Tax=Alteriqipengyuania lutimaris TaxID=1538146 RepID=A0A395LP93_9SPHN|nr:cell wall hydrolase [Alteriqipengyuania lutimaris]MBB3032638.1 spore germination cell wall hydrolase CwlJ-like protein [Alteriqipengyuania lutimaris]RDS78247.1 cell wall hydrolase [Alteriqipengyuania lutimaris]
MEFIESRWRAIRRSPWLRQNAPLVGVVTILLATFVALAASGGPSAPPAVEQGTSIAVPIQALPATGEDSDTQQSELPPGDAQARNAAVEVVEGGAGTAEPFVFAGTAADRARARDCLALAAMAEAGQGDADQRAVMQVILNRTRHPGFANTVCGVVYQGSQRRTGCQFTFTCDGSLSRSYSDTQWRAARQRAEEALGGRVEKAVGIATHYHANYVYPWWSDELDKIAVVGPHLFFRWRGFWGTNRAFSARYGGGEPDPMALRMVAQEVDREEPSLPSLVADDAAVRSITAETVGTRTPDTASEKQASPSIPPAGPGPGAHFVLVSAADDPAAVLDRARTLCPGSRFCQVYGWSEASAIPAQLPLPDAARRQLRFSYLAPRNGNAEAVFFDCRLFGQPATGRCLPAARP